ncbi:MAG: MMPL family transporter [Paludibacteraceae bacterium]|nr:MMPL family transporter [Paludibacteraceae bacterium]
MYKFPLSVYRFFKSHKIVFYITLIGSFLIFLALGLQITYEEDISKLLPSNTIGDSEQLVFDNLKVKDKVFILFTTKDSTVNTDLLSETCDTFCENLLAADSDSSINNILYYLDDGLMMSGIEYLFENVPVFLTENDYSKLDSAFSKESIDAQMAENFDMIQSADAETAVQLIQFDPVGLRNSLRYKAKEAASALGGNYKIIGGHFFTPDSTVCIAFLSPNFKAFDSKTGIRLTKQIENQVDSISEIHPDVEVLFHGAPITSVFNSRQIKKDLALTLGVSILFVILFISLCFKNASTMPMLLCPVIYGAFFALGIMYLIQGTMSLMALGIGAIILGVALSYCLHVITHYKYVSDPETVIKEQTKPVILGSLTTIGAFMGLVFTESALLRDFGIFASLAMVGTTLFCLLFLPQFFSTSNNKRSEKAFAWLEKINSYSLDKQTWLVIVLIVISGVCIFESRNVQFDSDLKNIGYHNPKVLRSSEMLSEKTAHGNYTGYFAVTGKNLDSALVYNKALDERLAAIKDSGEIQGFACTSTLLLDTDTQAERINTWNNYWTQDKKDKVKKNIIESGKKYGFDEDTFVSFFGMLDAEYQPSLLYDADILPEGLMSNWIEYTDSTYMVFTPVQITQENRRHASELIVETPHTVVIDPFFYTQDMVQILNNDFNTVLWISTLFVFIVLLISFRSLIIGTIAFLPMFLSWFIVLGIMNIFGLQFNLINIIISTFIFGVGVDYSIFVMDGLLAGKKGNTQLLTYHKTAIFLSAVVLVVSIASLTFATHPAISSIGLTTLIGMLATLLITYTLEPWLYKKNEV